MLFLILMAVMSTGSAEVIAVASIVIYDVYQAYICPFKPDLKDGQCILCSKYLRHKAGQDQDTTTPLCDCVSADKCEGCKQDSIIRAESKNIVKPHYTCLIHKNWCIVITTFFSIPLCLFCWAVNLNLTWTYYFTGILIASSVVPIATSILWARTTSYAVIAGVVGGAVAGMSVWLSYASTFPGGLSATTFVKNTGEELPMLFGNITAIGMGAVFTIVVTYITRWNMTPEIEEAEWEKTRDIDNPLSPWVAKYQGELNLDDVENFHDRPPLEIVIRKFRAAKITAYSAAVLFTLLFVCIWPGSMLSMDILDLTAFNAWTTMSRGWAFTAAAFIVIVPMYQEVRAVFKQLKKNKEDKLKEEENSYHCENQPLDPRQVLPNRLQNQMFAANRHANKQEFIFQRMRNTLTRLLAISK